MNTLQKIFGDFSEGLCGRRHLFVYWRAFWLSRWAVFTFWLVDALLKLIDAIHRHNSRIVERLNLLKEK